MKPADRVLRKLRIGFVAERSGISEYVLKTNSLRILLAPNPSARSVVVMQHIHVGSRHEGAGNTGYAHLLEHMLFKGTDKHNRGKGNSYDEFVKALGNEMNATTSVDYTNYFARVPAHAVRGLLEHESDRLRGAHITDEALRSEMPVVVGEFNIGENRPSEQLSKLTWAQAFTEHPYKVDTIGSKSDVLKVTADSLRHRLYDVYYWPNNVTLIIVGGFDVKQVLTDIAELYGNIPSSPRPIPQVYTVEPPQFGERRFVINKPGDLPLVNIAFHVPEADHEDHYALQALAAILGGSMSSRLYRRLVDKGLATRAMAFNQPTHDAGLFELRITVAQTSSPKQVERIALKEIERFQKKLVSAKELERTRKMTRNGTLMSLANQVGYAFQISGAEAVADWQWGVDFDDNFDKVTAEDIQRVARKYLVQDNRTVGWFVPSGALAPQDEPHEQPKLEVSDDDIKSPQFENRTMPVLTAGNNKLSYAKQVTKVTLPNGLKLLLMPTEAQSALGLSLTVNAGVNQVAGDKRMAAKVTAEMLSRGSKRFSKNRVNELTSEMLANINWNLQVTRSRLATLVPPQDLGMYFDLLADALMHPRFSPEELELVRSQFGDELEEELKDPSDRASTALTQALYQPGHPYRRDDADERKRQLSAVTVEDLTSIASTYGPKGAVLSLVGKFDVNEVRKLVEEKLGAWSGGSEPTRESTPSSISARGHRLNINIPGKDSLTILVGQPMDVSMSSPDYLAAAIANQALGGDTMASRLGYELRERRGLTYGVGCFMSSDSFGNAPWLVYMTTEGPKLERSVRLIHKIIEVFLQDGIGLKELALEKSTLLNSFALQLDGAMDVAASIAECEYAGVGLEFLDTYEQKVLALTPGQVTEALHKHFLVENTVTAVAGTLPEGTQASS